MSIAHRLIRNPFSHFDAQQRPSRSLSSRTHTFHGYYWEWQQRRRRNILSEKTHSNVEPYQIYLYLSEPKHPFTPCMKLWSYRHMCTAHNFHHFRTRRHLRPDFGAYFENKKQKSEKNKKRQTQKTINDGFYRRWYYGASWVYGAEQRL